MLQNLISIVFKMICSGNVDMQSCSDIIRAHGCPFPPLLLIKQVKTCVDQAVEGVKVKLAMSHINPEATFHMFLILLLSFV